MNIRIFNRNSDMVYSGTADIDEVMASVVFSHVGDTVTAPSGNTGVIFKRVINLRDDAIDIYLRSPLQETDFRAEGDADEAPTPQAEVTTPKKKAKSQ